ncbi:MAG: squalene--hopene cyclase [Phycisphaera sp.]|nr:squalene--hopene cyclase [Phycisphaera sp.]
MLKTWVALGTVLAVFLSPATLLAEGDWEQTPASEEASDRGLEWLARNQGEAGNWDSDDLGLVSMGVLAFLSAGHAPDRGKYGDNVRRAIDYIIANAKPSGLLNIASDGRDMYNHGLTVFVLTQAYGITNDRRIGEVLDNGLKLITDVQCEDGGWDYKAKRQSRGHDLSLAVMQAKALRGAMDIGLEIPPTTVEAAIRYVRARYKPEGPPDGKSYGDHPDAGRPGAFTYNGNKATTAMAACGAVCLQEFGLYNDFRIHRSMDHVLNDIEKDMPVRKGHIPFDAYTMYYVGQGLYQVGGDRWRQAYPKIRDAIIESQQRSERVDADGSWEGGKVGGKPGQLFGTAVAVFVLNIPNRYLPILQKGEADPENADRR